MLAIPKQQGRYLRRSSSSLLIMFFLTCWEKWFKDLIIFLKHFIYMFSYWHIQQYSTLWNVLPSITSHVMRHSNAARQTYTHTATRENTLNCVWHLWINQTHRLIPRVNPCVQYVSYVCLTTGLTLMPRNVVLKA